ncbi:hypothetical protein JJB07_20480 [Tumebacillus sp. ITR2]|uniref:Uncharacterized protein n=1 Tax=Tumebacillus amylolyticus TaxID=2801339 RepID=A0ABS1JFB5_9BACL|nr:hypothetical protein [Tumebacillus amylolyticus]MBL0388976.1 hypothetical protein [Tumebacillus amylolyticus]
MSDGSGSHGMNRVRRTPWGFWRMSVWAVWLAALPSVGGWLLEVYLSWTRSWEPLIGWAVILHSLLCLAWWVQSRWSALAEGRERGRGSVRKESATGRSKRWAGASRQLPAGCFLLLVLLGTMATLQVAHVFLVTVLCGLLGAIRAWNVNVRSKKSIRRSRANTILMTVFHGLVLTVWIAVL